MCTVRSIQRDEQDLFWRKIDSRSGRGETLSSRQNDSTAPQSVALPTAVETGTRRNAFAIIQICGERQKRKILPIHVVLEIENSRETRASRFQFVPRAVLFLRIEQETQA